MVQIVNKIRFEAFVIAFLFLVCSCSIYNKQTKYHLMAEKNELIGIDRKAPILEEKSLFLMALIAQLYEIPRKSFSEAYNRGYNRMEPSLFVGYKISGFQDTTYAKYLMAEHLCKKYGFFRKDSIYLDTIYSIEIIDRDKLPIQNENCDKHLFVLKKDSTEIYNTRPCVEWNSFFINIVNDLCHNQHCYPLKIPEGTSKMSMTIPVRIAVRHDIDALLAYYEEQYGVRIRQERIDSVEVVLIKKLE